MRNIDKYKINNQISSGLVAEDILKCYKDKFYFKKVTGEEGNVDIWRYSSDGYYVKDGGKVIGEITQKILGNSCSNYLVNEVVGWFKRYNNNNGYELEPTDLNNQLNLINLQNKTYNIETKRFTEHNPRYLMSTKMPIAYNPDAKINEIEQFLQDIFEGKRKVINTIQEEFGYCLYRDYQFQKAFLWLGGGANGKSTLAKLLTEMLGYQNVSSISLDDISSGNRFVAWHLYGKMANISTEIGKKFMSDTAIFKRATGGDYLMWERKRANSFQFLNYAKLFFAINEVPRTADNTHSFYRRWIPTEFNVQFEGSNCDINILDKLTTEEEISGLLRWSIEGLDRLLKNQKFTGKWEEKDTRHWWKYHTSVVYTYILENIELAPENVIDSEGKQEIYEDYKDFCAREGKYPKVFNSFCREFINVCQFPFDKKYREVGSDINKWKGIQLKK